MKEETKKLIGTTAVIIFIALISFTAVIKWVEADSYKNAYYDLLYQDVEDNCFNDSDMVWDCTITAFFGNSSDDNGFYVEYCETLDMWYVTDGTYVYGSFSDYDSAVYYAENVAERHAGGKI